MQDPAATGVSNQRQYGRFRDWQKNFRQGTLQEAASGSKDIPENDLGVFFKQQLEVAFSLRILRLEPLSERLKALFGRLQSGVLGRDFQLQE
jgi:hypothetical protein